MPIDAAEIWSKAKPVLFPYDGSASQLYVLDVPVCECATVIDLFTGFVEEPEVVALDSFWGEPRPLTSELRSELLSRTDKTTTHQLRGVRGRREHVSLFLWLDSGSRTLDAELVFYSDQLFPEPDDESACLETFEKYLGIAEEIRALSSSSQCVISAAETGDPRADRGKSWTCFW